MIHLKTDELEPFFKDKLPKSLRTIYNLNSHVSIYKYYICSLKASKKNPLVLDGSSGDFYWLFKGKMVLTLDNFLQKIKDEQNFLWETHILWDQYYTHVKTEDNKRK